MEYGAKYTNGLDAVLALGRKGKAETEMRILIKITRTEAGQTVEITVEPPA